MGKCNLCYRDLFHVLTCHQKSLKQSQQQLVRREGHRPNNDGLPGAFALDSAEDSQGQALNDEAAEPREGNMFHRDGCSHRLARWLQLLTMDMLIPDSRSLS